LRVRRHYYLQAESERQHQEWMAALVAAGNLRNTTGASSMGGGGTGDSEPGLVPGPFLSGPTASVPDLAGISAGTPPTRPPLVAAVSATALHNDASPSLSVRAHRHLRS
jgi:hypothetical protein